MWTACLALHRWWNWLQNADQFEECYRAALRQNPKLAPAGYVDPEAEKFQARIKKAAAKN
jgi:hypothetical protein